MTTPLGNFVMVGLVAAGFFLFGLLPQILLKDSAWTALSSPRFVLSCFLAGLVWGIMIIEEGNPKLERFSPWLRIVAGGISGTVIAAMWQAELVTLLFAVLVGSILGFCSRWLDF
jgi:hypothetical protein